MQRPLGSQNPTRPPQPASSSPFASHRGPAAPPGMSIGQGGVNPAGVGSSAGLTVAATSTGLPGGMGGARSGMMTGFPPGGLPSPAAGRTMGPGGAGLGGAGYASRSAGSTGAAGNNFVFGNAGGGYGQSSSHQGGGNIDLADFPALGSGVGVNQTPGPLTSSLGGAASRAAVAAAVASSAAAGARIAGNGSGFNTDDFPALGAPSVPGNNGPQSFSNGSQAQVAAAAAAAAAAAEQASAAAALQHQASQREVHRLGLLVNNVNGSPQVSNRGAQGQAGALNAACGGFGEMDRNYATKLGAAQASGLPALSTSTGGAQSWSQSGDTRAALPNGTSSRSPALTTTTTPASQILFSPADRFGLAGLLRIIKLQAAGPGAGGASGANPEDVGMLALGSDLQTLGLDVGSDHPLHPDFHTPWSSDAHPLQRSQRSIMEPDYHLPSCYNVQAPPPAQTKVANFSDETLFFIFYSTPRDILQEVAAVELHHRNWRFHKELQLWLTKEHNMEPTQKTPMYEKGQYVFWDVESWQRVTKNFVLLYELLEDRPALAVQAQGQQAQALQQQQQGGTGGVGQQPPTPSQGQATAMPAQAQPAGR